MSYLIFELTGDMAMWRNPYESMGSFSCLGPAPSSIAGLIGAALGFASPRSQGAIEQDEKHLQMLNQKGLPWPVSSELLRWEEANDYHVACRWKGGFPKRISWNVNGYKEFSKNDNLRIQQQVIEKPYYEIAIKLNSAKSLSDVEKALLCPAFPIFLGASFCRGILRNVKISETFFSEENWAMKKDVAWGECTPLSLHVVNQEEVFERIISDGYWLYPTPDFPGEIQADPFVRGYCRIEKA